MSDQKETTIERKARQAIEGKVAMRDYNNDHKAKLTRMPKLKEQRLARDAAVAKASRTKKQE